MNKRLLHLVSLSLIAGLMTGCATTSQTTNDNSSKQIESSESSTNPSSESSQGEPSSEQSSSEQSSSEIDSSSSEEEIIITEEYLLEMDYEANDGWPYDIVEEVMMGTDSTLTVPTIYEDSTWYTYFDLFEDEYGDYFYVDMFVKGEGAEAYEELLVTAGYEIYEGYDAYDLYADNGPEIFYMDIDGFLNITVCGPYLEVPPELGEVGSEVEHEDDHSIDVSFVFPGNVEDQTILDGISYETDHARITFATGENANKNAPKYYDNGETLRMYPCNTVTIDCISSDYDIDYIELYIGSMKGSFTGQASDFEVTDGTISSDYEVVTISNITDFTVTVMMNSGFTSGNIGFNKIAVHLIPSE